MRILAAQEIRYEPPQWLIEPQGEPLDEVDLDELHWMEPVVVTETLGWGPYTHIIKTEHGYLLAQLGKEVTP